MGRSKRKYRNEISRVSRRTASLALLLTGFLFASLAVLSPQLNQVSTRGPLRTGYTSLDVQSDDLVEESDSTSGRRLYPYSVIAGGVRSADELKAATTNDPVVARHYADFDLTKARVVSLDHDQMAYVSYRMGEQIFWTNRALRIHKGETVITDGIHEARTRCGNRISETPQSPLSSQQPALEAFNRLAPSGTLYAVNNPIDGQLTPPSPYSPSELLHPLAAERNGFGPPFVMLAPGPGIGSPGSLFSSGPGLPVGPGTPPGTGGTGGTGTGSPSGPGTPGGPGSPSGPGSPPSGPGSPGGPPIGTPEPGTLIMLSAGLLGLVIRRRFVRRG